MKPVIAFDLNGTLLDLSALDSSFEGFFGERQARAEWFAEVLKIALTTAAVQGYAEFSGIALAALKAVERRRQRELSDSERAELMEGMRKLPPFPDVRAGLESLRAADFRLAVLTNSGLDAALEALDHAGLNRYFERVLSAHSVRRLKPAVEPYQMAARVLGVEMGSLMLVAAHSWDVAGAIAAGCQACFLNRPGQSLDEITPKPDLVAAHLGDLSRQLSGSPRGA